MGLIIKHKKAFVFSFLALFVSFLIFGIASFKLNLNYYSKISEYEKSRIIFVDNEIKYFENIYLKDSLRYSTYHIIYQILNYSNNSSNYQKLNNNYSKLNSLLYEAIINGTLDGKENEDLNKSNFNKFIEIFKKNFKENYKSNISFKLLNSSIYEKNPYYLTFQFLIEYNVTMDDNLSSWNIKKNIDLSFPIYNFNNPDYLILLNKSIPVRPYDLYYSNLNWTLETLNDTINNSYSTIFTHGDYKYTIGKSFISRLLNITIHSYKNVIGFYSFDYDEEKGGVWDSSNLNSKNGNFYGNSYLIYNFNEKNIKDLTVYNHTGEINGNINLSALGIYKYGAEFDGNSEINISNEKFNLNFTNKISIIAWIKPNSYVDSSSLKGSEIFRYGQNENDVIDLRISSNGRIIMEIGNHSNGRFYKFISNENISLNEFSFIIGTFDGDTGIGKIYINSIFNNLNDDFSYQRSSPIKNFIKSNINIGIGNLINNTEHFNGTIDEIGIFTKILTSEEIAYLYENKKTTLIDYKKSFHGKGIEFNGYSNFINISSNNLSVEKFNNNFTISTWIKPYNISLNNTIISKYNPFKILINNSKLIAGIYTSDNQWHYLEYKLKLNNINYYIVYSWNQNNKEFELYLNGIKVNSTTLSNDINTNTENPIYIGVDNYNNIKSNYFFGLIDEIKIYNRTLNNNEISQNYYNFDETSKGCCNYITLINPNLFGFNSSEYNKNISYSSKQFFDYYFRNQGFKNASLWELTNITSNKTNEEYYNFLVDNCLVQTYNLPYNNSVELKIRNFGDDYGSCKNLIRMGIY